MFLDVELGANRIGRRSLPLTEFELSARQVTGSGSANKDAGRSPVANLLQHSVEPG